ncbi:zinc finger protein ZAT1-like [Phragmites australis]|uniref:zinc finger protein ZAT1-like n=1 Tax=Phragmites australis TaxID=29695 RepID=UPI002D78133C|nr:zinc finger protein ZAT1-like [Phragmites australis]
MPKNTCKRCSRRFASPRALAGHMRSHSVAAAAAAAAAATKQQISSASSASTSFTAADEDVRFKKPASIYALRENPKRSLRVADAGFSDRESEAESTPPRAKRASAAAAWGEAEPVSSLSDAATPEEDVALSLMMLSRDSWPSAARTEGDYYDWSDDGYALPAPPAPAPAEKRTQFQCSACKKVFRSYQALGGHRASNVRGGRGGCCAPPVAPPPPQPLPPSPLPMHDGDEYMDAKQQPRECPYCYRVFSSGQALGGHKRSHVCGAAAAAAHAATASTSAAPPSPIKNPGMIDLNVAPPFEEVELSAVSDPHFNPGS